MLPVFSARVMSTNTDVESVRRKTGRSWRVNRAVKGARALRWGGCHIPTSSRADFRKPGISRKADGNLSVQGNDGEKFSRLIKGDILGAA